MKAFHIVSMQKNSILLNHIKQCMVQFTTYFMTAEVRNTNIKTDEVTEDMQIIAAMIVGKR